MLNQSIPEVAKLLQDTNVHYCAGVRDCNDVYTKLLAAADEVNIIKARDYFAAHAPITLDDAAAYAVQQLKQSGAPSTAISQGEVVKCLASMRLAYADEMMKARAS